MNDRHDVSGGDPVPRTPRQKRGVRVLQGIDLSIRNLVNATMAVSGLCLVTILSIGAADTVGRAIWNYPILGAVEISEALLAVLIFSALAFAQKEGGHVVVDVFSSNYGPRLSRFVIILALVLTLCVLVFLAWRTGISAHRGWLHNEVSAGYFPVPVWLAKIAATAALFVACLECARELVRATLGLSPSGKAPTATISHEQSRGDL